MAKIPVLTTIHGQAHEKFLQKSITKVCAVTKKTKLVAISSQAYEQNKKFYGNDLVGYVYNCIEPSYLKFFKIPSKKHEIELCFLGILAPHKGAHIAIKIAERLHKNGKDVRLKIAGKTHKTYKTYTKKIISLVENKPYIELKPNISTDDISSFFGNSDALLLPIQWDEPFGLVMIESLYCGTPVIAFSRGSVPELIKNGKNGFICETENDMYDAILSLNKIERETCNSTVLEKFSADATYKKYMEYYEQIIKNS